MIRKVLYSICLVFSLTACVIEDDVPYPIVDGAILSMTVEGQRADLNGESSDALINKTDRMVTLFVNDSVDISRLKITKFTISPEAILLADTTSCVDFDNFPTRGFASLDSIPSSANTRVNFASQVAFTLRTYQDYVWKVSVTQIVNREVEILNQVGDAVIDPNTRNVIIYVSKDQSLSNIQINKMDLGGEYGRVEPDPITVKNFTSPRQFYVARSGEETMQKWTVYIYQTSDKPTGNSKLSVSAWSNFAYLEGTISDGSGSMDTEKVHFQYKQDSETLWKEGEGNVTLESNLYKITLKGLSPNTKYQCRIAYNEEQIVGSAVEFTTETQNKIPNLSFDDWVKAGKHYYAAASVEAKFWDSGNEGANTLNEVNPTCPEQTDVKTGKAAKLASATAAGQFAAGSLFTGDFGNATLNPLGAKLNFGQSYDERPSQMVGWYKYTPGSITHTKKDFIAKGDRDSCSIYIALTDWDAPFAVSTGDNKFVNFSDSHIIAYGELNKAEMSPVSMSSYKQFTIDLKYRNLKRKPKYILIVCSSSKYGDYFTGSTSSVLLLDEFDFIFGEPIVDEAYIK